MASHLEIENTDHKLAIVGCGNIGSRLLQSAAAAKIAELTVYGVEPYEPAREISAERFAQIDGPDGTPHTLRMVGAVDQLPPKVSLLIIACSAHQRMGALSSALEHTKPKAVLLEKVLFTRTSDYSRAETMLDGIPTWINTTRNIWPGYLKLKDILTNDPVILNVTGSDWSLASNAIHFLSLIETLANAPVTELTLSDTVARDSKRVGYRDLTGTMQAELSDGSRATLTSSAGEDNPMSIKLSQSGREYTLDEGNGTMNGEPFETLFTSQLGGAITHMLSHRTSDLPTLRDSSRLHRLYLDALRPHIHPRDPYGDICMVT